MTTARSIAVLLFPAVEEFDALGAYLPLRKAAQQDPPQVRPLLVAADPVVTGASGIPLAREASLAELLELDRAGDCVAVVVPGGAAADRACRDPRLLDALAQLSPSTRLYAVCSGALLLAAAGRLTGRAAVHHRRRDDLRRWAPTVEITDGLMVDGPVTTIGGVITYSVKGVDIALRVLHDLAPDQLSGLVDRLEVMPSWWTSPLDGLTA
ncbi:DJ-1/PfpI family protein [Micromonospora sp. NPDC051196]|uniref:DJ-1/PfpI family protein n=1 Tax=Micromonospora sp. NPDC051196 TaxID=3155281 RepID=UPI0034185385